MPEAGSSSLPVAAAVSLSPTLQPTSPQLEDDAVDDVQFFDPNVYGPALLGDDGGGNDVYDDGMVMEEIPHAAEQPWDGEISAEVEAEMTAVLEEMKEREARIARAADRGVSLDTTKDHRVCLTREKVVRKLPKTGRRARLEYGLSKHDEFSATPAWQAVQSLSMYVLWLAQSVNKYARARVFLLFNSHALWIWLYHMTYTAVCIQELPSRRHQNEEGMDQLGQGTTSRCNVSQNHYGFRANGCGHRCGRCG